MSGPPEPTWASLIERASEHATTVESVREALCEHRDEC